MAKDEILIEVKIDESDSIQSINSLRAANRELTKARNEVNLATAEGRQQARLLNAEIDKNNNVIKSNTDTLLKQKMNVGNYTQSILDAVPGLGKFAGGIKGVNTVMAANPIGLVITALMALKNIMLGNAEVADKVSFVFSAVSKAFQFITDTIVNTVKSFDNLKAALFNPIQFFKDLANGTIDAARAGYEAAEAIDQFVVVQAKANAEIEEADLRTRALEKSLKDRTKSERERIAIAEEIATLEIQNARRRQSLAEQELANERLILKEKTLSSEEEAKLIKLESEVKKAAFEADVVEAQKATRINILLEKERKEAVKQETEEIKQIRQEGYDFDVMKITQAVDKKIAEDQRYADELAKNLQESFEFEQEKAEEITLAGERQARARIASRELEENQKLGFLSRSARQFSVIATQQSTLQKALAITAASIDTYVAATAALKPPPVGAGPLFGPILAASTIALGLSNVQRIAGFAGGGRIGRGFGVPISRSNGDNILATVKTGEVILNERQQAALGGSRTFRSIGVPGFADGGVVGFPSSAIDTGQASLLDFSRLQQLLQSQPIKVTVEDINKGLERAKQVEVQATF
jgi:hypothetical protein